MDLFDTLKDIVENYRDGLEDIFIEQEMRRVFPGFLAYSRFQMSNNKGDENVITRKNS